MPSLSKNQRLVITKSQRLSAILAAASLLLLTPLLAMQFSKAVKWSIVDFAMAAVLLFGTGLLCELAMRNLKTRGARLIACGMLLVFLFLVWAELAVGIFGTPLAGT